MEHPAARVLAALEVLQARGWVGADELARRLEVDRRTVRRYMATLRDLGFPVEARIGRDGGYRLRPGFRLPPLMLTEDEALAVVLGLLAARRIGLASAAPASESALAKLERVLPLALRDAALSLDRTVEFTLQRRRASPAASPVLLTLALAANWRRSVEVGYRNFRGEVSERRIDPYGLVFHTGRWYLVGWDHRRLAQRTFRIDRMASATLSEETFTPPSAFNSAEEVSRSLASVAWERYVEVLLGDRPRDRPARRGARYRPPGSRSRRRTASRRRRRPRLGGALRRLVGDSVQGGRATRAPRRSATACHRDHRRRRSRRVREPAGEGDQTTRRRSISRNRGVS